MKQVFIAIVLLFSYSFIHAQQMKDPQAPYLRTKAIPEFKILQTDSSWFTKDQIPKNKAVVMIYFSPECGHCQITSQQIVSDMDNLKNIFFIFASYHAVDALKSFAHTYKLDQYTNIRLGRDPAYFIPSFYQVKSTPFMAVYGKDGKLIQAYEKGTDPETILQLLKNTKQL